LELVAMRPQRARDLEHGGIAGGIVADADVPRIIMAVQQHELVRLALASNFVTTVARPPFSASAISASPSALFTATAGIAGLCGRSSRSEVPQVMLPP